jgi:hypothetical protein
LPTTGSAIVTGVSTKVRTGAGLVAAGLFIWLLVLFFARPTLRYGPGIGAQGSVTVKCNSVVAAFVGEDHTYDELADHGSYESQYTVVQGEIPGGTVADPFGPDKQIDAQCDQVLNGRAGMIGLLAVPVAVLATVSLLGRRRDDTDAAARKKVRKLLAKMPGPTEPLTG